MYVIDVLTSVEIPTNRASRERFEAKKTSTTLYEFIKMSTVPTGELRTAKSSNLEESVSVFLTFFAKPTRTVSR